MDYRQEAQKWAAKAYEILMAEELRRQDEIKREKELANNPETFIDKANKGDVDAILKLKEFAKDGNETAKDALEKLYWDGNKEHAVGTVVIRDGLKKLAKETFENCWELTAVILPESLTSIEFWAFSGCSGLKEIHIPDNVETFIGLGIFSYVSNDKVQILSSEFWDSVSIKTLADFRSLESISLPEGITSIGWGAFRCCRELKEIKLPNDLQSIGEMAFEYCSSLQEIKLHGVLVSIGHSAFNGCSGLKEIYIPDNDKNFIGLGHFKDAPDKAKIFLSKFWDSVGIKTLADFRSLENISLPKGITLIGDDAFRGCSRLTKISFPENLTTIGRYSFSGCSGLTEIKLPEGLTSIGYGAFACCRGLTEIKLPNSLTSISESAFEDCSSLKKITYNRKIESQLKDAFGSHWDWDIKWGRQRDWNKLEKIVC